MTGGPPRDGVEWHEGIAAGFSARYDKSAAFRERLSIWSRLIDAHVPPGGEALDAGCGPGHLSRLCARRDARVTALDAAGAMLEIARAAAAAEHLDIAFVSARIGDPTALADRRFDVILCSSVLEYVEDLDAALAWLAQRLGPGGTLVVSMPNGPSLYRRLERLAFRLSGRPRYCAFQRHAPAPDDFAHRLERHGLRPDPPIFHGGPSALRPLLPGPALREPLMVFAARAMS